MILAVMNAIYAIAYLEAWKSQDFNRVWTRDLAIVVRRSNQLSYEATDVGTWSFVGLEEPMWSYIWKISYLELGMWNQISYDPRSYKCNLCNCVLILEVENELDKLVKHGVIKKTNKTCWASPTVGTKGW